MKTVCFDFGNSRLKAAVFEDELFSSGFLLEDDSLQTIKEIIEKIKPGKTILSSVISHASDLEDYLASKSTFHKVSAKTKLNYTIDVSRPETVGTDRLAVSAAAVNYFPGKNNLVIVLGSCITYNFVNQYNSFLGGSISPGMDMRFKAMKYFTAKLPEVTASPLVPGLSYPLVGYNTVTNMQSGVVNGITCEIEGMIRRYEERYDNFNVVLTGGNCTYFASQLKNKIFADSNFLFKGLYVLSELNN